MVASEVNIPEAFQPNIEQTVKILKDGGCTEVFLFGSLAEGCSRADSDIDLAVRGCPPRDFLRIYGELILKEYLHFRHFFRHNYMFVLERERLDNLVRPLPEV